MLLDEMSDGDISKLWDLSGVVCAMCQHCHIPRVYRPCLFFSARVPGLNWVAGGCAQRQRVKSPIQWEAATNFEFNLNSEVRVRQFEL